MEQRRTTGFLLGLVVALALCFGALELTMRDSQDSMDEEWLEDLAQDLEQLPAMEQRDYVVATEQVQTKPQATDQVREVKEEPLSQASQAAEEPHAVRPLTPVEVPQQMVVDPMAVPAIPVDMDENPLKLRVVEDAPHPAQGWPALMKWLTNTLKYPPTAKTQKIQGTVLVRFVVNADGSVDDVKVAKSADPLLDREALRVVKMMPAWEPGIKTCWHSYCF